MDSFIPSSKTRRLGIRKATDLALSAFLSSAFSSAHGADVLLPGDIKMENYIEVQEALDLWKAQFSEDKEQELPEDVTVQTLWDQPVFELRYQELLDNQSVPTEKARLIAAHCQHSSGWLTAVPVTAPKWRKSGAQGHRLVRYHRFCPLITMGQSKILWSNPGGWNRWTS